ncbi:TetR family transcriptional regulator [Halarcobacter ebronensis]|uniref:TetR family transcriptional regulator n=1 Tax=Halarcobacter ebronensis TaxID=1462615 RepID=A0A4Q0Y5T6_9BACT|nr:TetR/AcrR family transcriptional regulator [Halarcobacter ebronensis]RXJ65527.1 TetR family transcriptional regulator [Halarcobacter ebronensis]
MNETREKLIDVAYEEIYEFGYYATSVDKILKKANMNKGSMYHFFKSKKELGLAVINERIKKYTSDKYTKLTECEKNIIDELLKLLRKRDSFDFKLGCKINNLVQELSPKDDDFKKALEQVYLLFESLIEKTLENAVKAGEIEYEDTRKLAIYVVASIEGCLITAKKSQDGQMFYDCLSQLEFFLNSLKK